MGTEHALRLAPIHVPAAYEHVAARLRRAIWLGELIPGERLPSEREMAEGFEVSRLTIREALRVLQGEGLIAIRRGNGGGSTITSKQVTAAQRHNELIEARHRLLEVHEIRLGIEPMAARLAAERATAEHIAQLEQKQLALVDSDDLASFRRADSAFHVAIAAASGNRLLERAVEDARSALFIVIDVHEFDLVKHTSAHAHGDIVQAIAGRKGERAATLMASHIEQAWAEISAVIDGEPTSAAKVSKAKRAKRH